MANDRASAEDLRAYSKTVIDHFQHPRNAGSLDNANAVGEDRNPVCGDHMKLMLRIEADTIAAASFQTRGCPAAIATSSMATVMLTDLPIDDAAQLNRQDFVDAVGGLPKSKVHCSVLAAAALKRALDDYHQRRLASESA